MTQNKYFTLFYIMIRSLVCFLPGELMASLMDWELSVLWTPTVVLSLEWSQFNLLHYFRPNISSIVHSSDPPTILLLTRLKQILRLFVNLVLSTSYRLPNASSWIIVLIKSSIFAQSGTYFIGWQCEYYCILLSSCSVANRCTAKQLTRINLIVCYRCFIATI